MIELALLILKAFVVFLLVVAVVGAIMGGIGGLSKTLGKFVAHYKAMVTNPHDIGELVVGGVLWLLFFGVIAGTIYAGITFQ